MKIFPAMQEVMKSLKPIAKSRKNKVQNFNFRGIEDLYNCVQPIMAKHGIVMTQEIVSSKMTLGQTKSGGVSRHVLCEFRFRFVSTEDGSFVDTMAIGEAQDTSDKACNKAMSIAHKYALVQTFLIPTGMDDPEKEEGKSSFDL